jgi:HEAT repeat protein
MLRPLGPEGDPAQREEEEAAWTTRAAGDSTILAALLDLTRNPATENERGRISAEAFQEQLAHVLSLAGAFAPAAVIDRVGALTEDLRARATAIEVLGTIGDPAGLRWLVPLVDSGDLSEDEASWLASSLCDIGTSEARLLLDRLAARTSPEHAGVHREIQIARDAIARRTKT